MTASTTTAPTYVYIPNAIFDATVSSNAKLTFAALCKFADKNTNQCYPSHRTLAELTGLAVSTLKIALGELVASNLLTIEKRFRNSRRTTNLYTIARDRAGKFFRATLEIFKTGLTAKARTVLIFLQRLASGKSQAFPAHKTTAAKCGLSKSAARSAIDEIEAEGLLDREHQFVKNGRQTSNLYTLDVELQNETVQAVVTETETVETELEPEASTEALEASEAVTAAPVPVKLSRLEQVNRWIAEIWHEVVPPVGYRTDT
jgi:DNA-binding transcriptional MocR family regulator